MRRITLTIVIALLALPATAGAIRVPPSPGAAGRGCDHGQRLVWAKVSARGADVILRHPRPHTVLRYTAPTGRLGGAAFRIRANRHRITVLNDSPREIDFRAACR